MGDAASYRNCGTCRVSNGCGRSIMECRERKEREREAIARRRMKCVAVPAAMFSLAFVFVAYLAFTYAFAGFSWLTFLAWAGTSAAVVALVPALDRDRECRGRKGGRR